MFGSFFRKESAALTVAALLLSNSALAYGTLTQDEAVRMLKSTLSSTPACIVSEHFKEFPVAIEKRGFGQKHQQSRELLSRLQAAGLLSMEEKQVTMEKRSMMVVQRVPVSAEVYSLTDLGKQYFREDAVMITRGTNRPAHGPGLCYADSIEVTEIIGFRVNTLEYVINAVNRADWANDKDLIASGLIVDRAHRPITVQSTGSLVAAMQARKEAEENRPEVPTDAQVNARFSLDTSGNYQLMYY